MAEIADQPTSPPGKPWPPPPDLHSVQELTANADVEGFIAAGAPVDEYETEAEQLFKAIATWSTEELTSVRLLPILEEIWAEAFSFDEAEVAKRRPALEKLAADIERFFGPGAQPQVRGA
ncbi:MAG TPA: hypothetical protein VM865_08720 [Acidobacteriaceae bacterium]|jgi:hypothetical protein|nr:hypothetical protein [Acidobacteriaceae bacterium]